MTVYEPVMSGVQVKVNMPLESLVAVPICRLLPFESMTLIATGTPVVSVGFGFCM